MWDLLYVTISHTSHVLLFRSTLIHINQTPQKYETWHTCNWIKTFNNLYLSILTTTRFDEDKLKHSRELSEMYEGDDPWTLYSGYSEWELPGLYQLRAGTPSISFVTHRPQISYLRKPNCRTRRLAETRTTDRHTHSERQMGKIFVLYFVLPTRKWTQNFGR